MQLSAVVLTKNEENNIVECISTLSFCDEVIVIDDNSSDKTVDLAKKAGAIIYTRSLNSDFAAQRNFGLEKAKGKWVLFIDADERVSRDLANEVTQIVNDPMHEFEGLYVRRIDEMWGEKIMHGESGNIKLLRLAKKTAGMWVRDVHETWEIKGATYLLKNQLLHYPHQTLREFIADIDRMSTIHARSNRDEKKRSNIFKIMFWPPVKFFYNYIVRGGFRDGTEGFVCGAMMSFHSYLAWSKLWLLQKKSAKN